jgi:hypothetical protein
MADHGILYEHEGFYQLLFGTSRDSVTWHLKNRGYRVRREVNNVISADWDDGQGVEVHFDTHGAQQIFYCTYYAVMDGSPGFPTPVEIKRRKRR